MSFRKGDFVKITGGGLKGRIGTVTRGSKYDPTIKIGKKNWVVYGGMVQKRRKPKKR